MIGLPRKTLFIDRNSGGRIFRQLIQNAGIDVILHDEKFDQYTPDETWIKKVGEQGWVTVSADIAIEKHYLFLSALKRSKAHVFLLRGLVGVSRDQKAQCIIDAYPTIVQLCHLHDGPKLWKANRSGQIISLDFKHSLGLLRRRFSN